LLAAVVLLAWNPYTVYDAGFQLSFAAVVAIFVLVPPLQETLAGYPGPRGLHTAVAISVACSVVTAPLLWLQFGRVPVLGVVANALVEPAVGPLLGLAFASAAVAPVAPPLAAALAVAERLARRLHRALRAVRGGRAVRPGDRDGLPPQRPG
jgi:ComEC/Rec2-related protein